MRDRQVQIKDNLPQQCCCVIIYYWLPDESRRLTRASDIYAVRGMHGTGEVRAFDEMFTGLGFCVMSTCTGTCVCVCVCVCVSYHPLYGI
jgi:hypothetical protein